MDKISEVLKGTVGRDLERLGPQVLAGVLPRIYPEMLAEVHSHQDEGRPTFIVSAAGNDLVEMVARVLGMEGGIGTRYELDSEGRLHRRLDGPFMYGEGKLEGMRGFADAHDIDLGESWAYSDSASDLPMLRAVGHAVAVNPDAPLLEVARERGWDVMRFEKLGRRLAVAGGDADGRRGRRRLGALRAAAQRRSAGSYFATPALRAARIRNARDEEPITNAAVDGGSR